MFGGTLSEVFAEKICKVMDLALRYGCPVIGHQRLGRRAHPGGRRLARRLRRDLLAQRPGLGRDPAALAGHGPVRRRRRLLARDDRLHLHGRGHVVHVHHRPRRREDGHAARRSRSRSSAAPTRTRRSRASRTSLARRGGVPRGRALPALVPPAEQRRAPPLVSAPTRPGRPSRTPSSTRSIPDSPNKPYDMHDVITRVVDDGEFLEVQAHFAENIVVRLRAARRPSVGIVGNQPARSPACSTSTPSTQGGALRALLRRVQHPARHVRGRARLPARDRPGVGRDHPARREAALRVLARRRCRSSR